MKINCEQKTENLLFQIFPLNSTMFSCSPPDRIVFEGHSTTETRATVLVKSLVRLPMLVKVRTTTPHKFSVVPHTTLVRPGTTVPIRIILHPFVSRPGRTGTKTDKFLLQVSMIMRMVISISNSYPIQNPYTT